MIIVWPGEQGESTTTIPSDIENTADTYIHMRLLTRKDRLKFNFGMINIW